MDSLRKAGPQDPFTVLASRAVAEAPLDNPSAVCWPRWVGAGDQIRALLGRDPAAAVSLDDLYAVSWLLDKLRWIGADDQVVRLAGRAAAEAPFSNPLLVCDLLRALRKAGADDQVRALLGRNPAAAVPLDNLYAVGSLVSSLRRLGADDQVITLANRAATEAPLDPLTAAFLLDRLREAGAHEQFSTLAERMPAAGWFDEFRNIDDHRERFRFGCEWDGSPSAAWTWDDLG
ncbi:hypothetical protein [Nonomuraea sp. SYSU D8015]|uniref:hypothetical protein n=1 Tax=Nonomuraea sp. SYSU D8015 TaxID=2593644 RepID=UPI0016612A61|nr:hypothetical protein [Nonomuraea sp. SYSU D8015]